MHGAIELPPTGEIPDDLKREVCERTLAIRAKYNVKYVELARQLGQGCSPSIVSTVLRGEYAASDAKWIRNLNLWNESFLRRQETVRCSGIVTTGVVRAVKALAEYSQTQGCITAGWGPAGIGKSEAAKVYASENPNSAYVRLRSTHTTPAAFLRLVAAGVHIPPGGGASQLCDAIVAKLTGSHRLLIIDEWHLANHHLHEAIRDIHDEAGCPVLLLGTVEIYVKLQQTRSQRGQAVYDQFFSRVGWALDLTRLQSSGGSGRPLFAVDEIRQVFKSDSVRLTPDGLRYLQALACSFGLGCLRIARRCFEMAARIAKRQDKPVDAAMLRKALIEQAVPPGTDPAPTVAIVEDSAASIAALAG